MKRRTLKRYMLGLGWVMGLLLAGSDSGSMPWPNLGGLLIFCWVSCRLAGKSPRSYFLLKFFVRHADSEQQFPRVMLAGKKVEPRSASKTLV